VKTKNKRENMEIKNFFYVKLHLTHRLDMNSQLAEAI